MEVPFSQHGAQRAAELCKELGSAYLQQKMLLERIEAIEGELRAMNVFLEWVNLQEHVKRMQNMPPPAPVEPEQAKPAGEAETPRPLQVVGDDNSLHQ